MTKIITNTSVQFSLQDNSLSDRKMDFCHQIFHKNQRHFNFLSSTIIWVNKCFTEEFSFLSTEDKDKYVLIKHGNSNIMFIF